MSSPDRVKTLQMHYLILAWIKYLSHWIENTKHEKHMEIVTGRNMYLSIVTDLFVMNMPAMVASMTLKNRCGSFWRRLVITSLSLWKHLIRQTKYMKFMVCILTE